MTKTVVILQSSYIPWRGYFDLIRDADEFVFFDDVQFTTRDWRTRNLIKTPQGLHWLSIPAGSNRARLICDVALTDQTWQARHFKTICSNYMKTPFFYFYKEFLEFVYLERKWESLSDLNQFLIREIAVRFLGIETQFRDSRELGSVGKGQDKLLDILRKIGGTTYISGPAAKSYIQQSRFDDAEIDLVWKNYSGYPEYEQRFPPFAPNVSVLDLLFNVGPDDLGTSGAGDVAP